MTLAKDSTATNSARLKQISIVGAGAIGQLIYHQLSSAANGSNVSLNIISRDKYSRTHTLTFTDLNNVESTHTAELVGQDDYEQQLPKTELLIVCVKAYQVATALKILIPMLSSNCHILLLHNGMGPHLDVANMLKGQSLTLGTTSQGALKQSAWHTKQTGKGVTQLGTFNSQSAFNTQNAFPSQQAASQHSGAEPLVLPESLKNILLAAIPHSQWCADILTMLWQKLAINVAINPLTAIHNCRNGELADEQYRDSITAAVTELVYVAKAEHISLALSPLLERVYQVIALTADNYSSMHQDVQHQRTTEIDAINGFVVQIAKRHGIATPHNQQLVDHIEHLELQYQR
ncbi:2-dehydropantoate 2-reductase [Shewanella sp. KX20019]|uniref:ketopantoate reductase family protein n=1 Tax=Shewanella sp. KX20019 TaxID=2803864 RepID=UPI00192896F3|nr:2-dehydropantoate 2-reductase [Shewanella sp. KX20019]QQX79248.1 2-dehydropantoate 2-reductase [Shewanella sp. KX20019]